MFAYLLEFGKSLLLLLVATTLPILNPPGVAAARTSGAMVGAAVVAVVILFSYRYAQAVLRSLGETGTLIFLRLSAFILLCLGIQIMCDGLAPLLTAAVNVGMQGTT